VEKQTVTEIQKKMVPWIKTRFVTKTRIVTKLGEDGVTEVTEEEEYEEEEVYEDEDELEEVEEEVEVEWEVEVEVEVPLEYEIDAEAGDVRELDEQELWAAFEKKRWWAWAAGQHQAGGGWDPKINMGKHWEIEEMLQKVAK